jgi:hypothetical protein
MLSLICSLITSFHVTRKRSVNVYSSQGSPAHLIGPPQATQVLSSGSQKTSFIPGNRTGGGALTSTQPITAHSTVQHSAADLKILGAYCKVNRQRSICDLRYETNETFLTDQLPVVVVKFPNFFSSDAFKARLMGGSGSQYLDLDMHLGVVDGCARIIKVIIYAPETGRQESLEVKRSPEQPLSYTGGFSLVQLIAYKSVWRTKGNVSYIRASQTWDISIDALGPGMEYTTNGRGHLSESYNSLLKTLPTPPKPPRPVRIKLIFTRVPVNGWPARCLAALAISDGRQETSVVKYNKKHMFFADNASLPTLIESFWDQNNPYFPSAQYPFAYEGLAHRGSSSSSPFPILFLTNIKPLQMIDDVFENALTRFKATFPKAGHTLEHEGALNFENIERFMSLLWPYLHMTGDGSKRNFTCWLQLERVKVSNRKPSSAVPMSIAFLDHTNSMNIFHLSKNDDWFYIQHTFEYYKEGFIGYTACAKLLWSEAFSSQRQPLLQLSGLTRIERDFP